MRNALLLGVALLVGAFTVAPASAQSTGGDPTYGSVRLRAGFLPDPHTVSMTAGGSVSVNMGECTYGHVASSPDVNFYYDANGSNTLYFYARSGSDTTLLINEPDGSWVCNDDGLGEGTNPMIVLPGARSGLYNVWVGTYGTSLSPATLYISEIDPR